jgi:hypothetical protein
VKRRSTRTFRTRAGIGVALAVVMVVAGLGLATPAGALGTARANGCRPFTVAKARVHAAATGREASLSALVAALQARPDPWSINAGQVNVLQGASSGISTLDAHVQSTCYPTAAPLRADATPLWTTYRVYWLRVPQTHAIQAADRLAEARARLGTAATRLSTHVGSNTKAQADLAAMNQALAAADAQLGVPPAPAAPIAALTTLAPAVDMTADVAAVETARTALLAARTSLVQARADGLAVIADLGG